MKTKLLLSEREYVCSACGLILDRDVNAAVNLARLSLKSLPEGSSGTGRGGQRKMKEPLGSDTVAVETSISRQLITV